MHYIAGYMYNIAIIFIGGISMIDISGHFRSENLEIGYEDKQNYFTVNCCGYQKYISLSSRMLREEGRLDFQILYIIKGKGSFRIAQNVLDVQGGSIAIYHPGEIQQYTYSSQDNTEVYWIHFTGYGAEEFLQKAGLWHKPIYTIGIDITIIELYKKIIYELQLKRPLYELTASTACLELVALMGRKSLEVKNSFQGKRDEKIYRVIEELHSSYNIKWSVTELSNMCNLSPFQFIRNFKAHTGMTPIDYLIKIRIDKAKEFLLSTSLSIHEISEILGYENAFYFSRIFKRKEGVSPEKYRNKNK